MTAQVSRAHAVLGSAPSGVKRPGATRRSLGGHRRARTGPGRGSGDVALPHNGRPTVRFGGALGRIHSRRDPNTIPAHRCSTPDESRGESPSRSRTPWMSPGMVSAQVRFAAGSSRFAANRLSQRSAPVLSRHEETNQAAEDPPSSQGSPQGPHHGAAAPCTRRQRPLGSHAHDRPLRSRTNHISCLMLVRR